MDKSRDHPKIISIIAILLGSLDILRGVMHTFLINYAAANIAGLDLSTPQAADLLQLMGAFGISNYITGAALILSGWKSRQLAHYLLGIIPAAYLIGGLALRFNTRGYSATQSAWGGIPMMTIYLVLCVITFLYGLLQKGK